MAAVSLPVVLAGLWGTLAVPDDPKRSSNAPLPVPGVVCRILELTVFGLAAWLLGGRRVG